MGTRPRLRGIIVAGANNGQETFKRHIVSTKPTEIMKRVTIMVCAIAGLGYVRTSDADLEKHPYNKSLVTYISVPENMAHKDVWRINELN